MSWSTSNRRDRLPPDWHQIRRRIGKRDAWLCQWRMPGGGVCGKAANQVDHIRAGDDHSDENLQCLCQAHHDHKSGGEGARATWQKRREISQRFRREEVHPGLL